MGEVPPQGWYEDPASPDNLRWWDGSQWTSHSRPRPARAMAMAASAPESTLAVESASAEAMDTQPIEQVASATTQVDTALPEPEHRTVLVRPTQRATTPVATAPAEVPIAISNVQPRFLELPKTPMQEDPIWKKRTLYVVALVAVVLAIVLATQVDRLRSSTVQTDSGSNGQSGDVAELQPAEDDLDPASASTVTLNSDSIVLDPTSTGKPNNPSSTTVWTLTPTSREASTTSLVATTRAPTTTRTPTTRRPTTRLPTTGPATTAPPSTTTTLSETTAAPTSVPPTTVAPSTVVSSTTLAPSTTTTSVQPSTTAPFTTLAPSTTTTTIQPSTTAAPTTTIQTTTTLPSSTIAAAAIG